MINSTPTKLTAAIVLFFLTACTAEIVGCDQVKLENGRYLLTENGDSYSGKLECFHENGALHKVQQFENGLRTGTWTEYSEKDSMLLQEKFLGEDKIRGFDKVLCTKTGAERVSISIWHEGQKILTGYEYMNITLYSKGEIDTTELRELAWLSQYSIDLGTNIMKHIYVEKEWNTTTPILDIAVNKEFFQSQPTFPY